MLLLIVSCIFQANVNTLRKQFSARVKNPQKTKKKENYYKTFKIPNKFRTIGNSS